MENCSKCTSIECVINNRLGLHARPASLFVQTALNFKSEIEVRNMNTQAEADGKSVMSMLMLVAPSGTPLKITAKGEDSEAAIKRLSSLILEGFGDD